MIVLIWSTLRCCAGLPGLGIRLHLHHRRPWQDHRHQDCEGDDCGHKWRTPYKQEILATAELQTDVYHLDREDVCLRVQYGKTIHCLMKAAKEHNKEKVDQITEERNFWKRHFQLAEGRISDLLNERNNFQPQHPPHLEREVQHLTEHNRCLQHQVCKLKEDLIRKATQFSCPCQAKPGQGATKCPPRKSCRKCKNHLCRAGAQVRFEEKLDFSSIHLCSHLACLPETSLSS